MTGHLLTTNFRALAAAVITLLAAQTQAPPTPPTSPFASAAIRPASGHGTPVSLTFSWPAGMTATIEAERSKTTETPQGRNTTGGTLRYRMRVSEHKDGRLIEYDNFEPIGMSLAPSERSALTELLSALMPSMVVASTGEFVRVGDLTAIRAAIRQIIDAAKKGANAGPLPPNLQAVIDSLSTEEVLSTLAAAEWQAFGGAFLGFEGAIGDMREFDSEEPLPIMPGLTIPMRSTAGALRLEPCEAGRPPDSCVVMRLRSIVDPGAMQTFLNRMLQGAKGAEGIIYDRVDVTTEVLTTLEPSTMRPYRVSFTKKIDMSVSVPGEGRTSGTMTDRRSYRIMYK